MPPIAIDAVLGNHVQKSSGLLFFQDPDPARPAQGAQGARGSNRHAHLHMVLDDDADTMPAQQPGPPAAAAVEPAEPVPPVTRGNFVLDRCLYIPGLKHMLDNLQCDMFERLSWYPSFIASCQLFGCRLYL